MYHVLERSSVSTLAPSCCAQTSMSTSRHKLCQQGITIWLLTVSLSHCSAHLGFGKHCTGRSNASSSRNSHRPSISDRKTAAPSCTSLASVFSNSMARRVSASALSWSPSYGPGLLVVAGIDWPEVVHGFVESALKFMSHTMAAFHREWSATHEAKASALG